MSDHTLPVETHIESAKTYAARALDYLAQAQTARERGDYGAERLGLDLAASTFTSAATHASEAVAQSLIDAAYASRKV